MEHREIAIGFRATSFRFVVSAVPFIWCLAFCIPTKGSEAHLLEADATSEAYWKSECRPFAWGYDSKKERWASTTDPWSLVFLVWIVSVMNVWSFQYETHLRSRTRNKTVLIDKALEDHKRANWPSLQATPQLASSPERATSEELAPRLAAGAGSSTDAGTIAA